MLPDTAASKVTAAHLSRRALLYVRQSSLKQVLHNTESAIRQYDLRGKAIALGGAASQITVIDIDQGHSGASAADREGFQQLAAEVSLGRAGIVLGLECSRLARNNADWHQLLEICAMTGTLICDEDGLYDPRAFNDRLVLGMKGQLSEYELHFLRARLRGGQLSAARRGELIMPLPVGLVYDAAGHVILDPDTAIAGAVRHLFTTFEATGSATAVVQALPPAGPPREGPALLQGIIICGRCGHRMTVRYHTRGSGQVPTYACQRDGIENARPSCAVIPGHALDERVGQLLIATLTPLAAEAALQVSAELRQRADEADALRAAHVERARYHADLARRRYLAVDPANRLVAGTLEADWNTALRALNDAQAACDKAREQHTGQLTHAQKDRIAQLVTDLPGIWNDPATPARERKRIARLLLTDVTVTRTASTITAHVRLSGGQTSTLTLPMPKRAWELRQTPGATIAEIDQLLDHHTCAEIAAILRRRGLPNGVGRPFTPVMVQQVIRTYQLRSRRQRLADAGLIPLSQMAGLLGVSTATVK